MRERLKSLTSSLYSVIIVGLVSAWCSRTTSTAVTSIALDVSRVTPDSQLNLRYFPPLIVRGENPQPHRLTPHRQFSHFLPVTWPSPMVLHWWWWGYWASNLTRKEVILDDIYSSTVSNANWHPKADDWTWLYDQFSLPDYRRSSYPLTASAVTHLFLKATCAHLCNHIYNNN